MPTGDVLATSAVRQTKNSHDGQRNGSRMGHSRGLDSPQILLRSKELGLKPERRARDAGARSFPAYQPGKVKAAKTTHDGQYMSSLHLR